MELMALEMIWWGLGPDLVAPLVKWKWLEFVVGTGEMLQLSLSMFVWHDDDRVLVLVLCACVATTAVRVFEMLQPLAKADVKEETFIVSTGLGGLSKVFLLGCLVW